MKKIFDSVVVAAVYRGDVNLIPDDRLDLKRDVEILTEKLISNPKYSVKKFHLPFGGEERSGRLGSALREHFGSFCDFDCSVSLYLEHDSAAQEHPAEKRIDVVRGLARQFIKPIEMDI